MEKPFYVYLLASKRNGTLYPGVTSDIIDRVWQHKNGLTEGFTKKYSVTTLVYYEIYQDAEHAIRREKQIKAGSRKKKEELINSMNKEWVDLCERIEIAASLRSSQ